MHKYLGHAPRARWHDYNNGIYFVTVCCRDHKCMLGRIVDGEMIYYRAGKQLEENLKTIADGRYPDVFLLNYVVMPNHFHIVIQIGTEVYRQQSTSEPAPNSRLPVIVNGIKGNVKRFCNKNDIDFSWQASFHDHYIKNEASYRMIMEYVDGNVENWMRDKYCR